jgi:ribonucleoside-diphosphate reductase beta chain
MGGEERDLVLWALSSLMVAEERITTKFSGLVGAYGSEEEATFLATQQVDEARHMQFYASPAFAKVFDEALVQAHERLVRNPADPRAKVAFVTTYHLVIEATLGLTAFEFITRYLERKALLPGFVVGYTKIHHDEHRHVGYGTWYLQTAWPRTSRLGTRSVRPCATCCPRWPHRSPLPTAARTPTGTRSAPAPTRSAPSPSAG